MAFSIRRLKIRQQIQLVILPPLFALLCALSVLFYSFWMSRLTERSVRKSEESLAQIERVSRQFTEMHSAVRDYLLTGDQAALAPYDLGTAALPAELDRLRELESGSDTDRAAGDALGNEIKRWQAEWARPTIVRIERGARISTDDLLRDGDRRMAAFRKLATDLYTLNKSEDATNAKRMEQAMRNMLVLGVVLCAVVAGALLLLSRVVTRLIARPVQQLIEASERVSRGDFELSLPPPVENEFGVLSQSFWHMTTALRQEREEMAALNRFSEAVTQCTSESEIYEQILYSLKERFRPQQIIIFRLNTVENYLEAVGTLAALPEELREWPVIEEPHNCKAVRMGRRFRVNDVTEEPLCPAKFLSPKEGSYYCGPLIAGGVIIGAVRLEGARDFWTGERERLLEGYLSVASSALSNLRLLVRMKERANVDELTGLYNRRFLDDYARKLIAIASRKESPFGIIMLDLDHFKEFNDLYGHEVGDRILRHFSKTVTRAMREANLAARYGGEEFIVVLPDTGAKGCHLVAERIRKAVEKMVVPSGTDKPLPKITVSLGIAVYPDHAKTFEELLQASDKALYESKRAGRNRSTLYVEQPEAAT